jgi:hypothetical protein
VTASDPTEPAQTPTTVIGPLGLLALVLAFHSLRNRSLRAGTLALAVAAVETSWSPYRRMLRDPRLRDFNFVMVFPEHERR